MIALQVLDVSPASNPDKIRALAVFSGDYGVQGVGDLLNIAPYDVTNNPTGMTNPKNIPLPAIPTGLEVAPSIVDENIGGYYVQPAPLAATGATNGVANTTAAKNGFGLKMFSAEGVELATAAAYAAAVTGANDGVVIEIQLPHDQ